MMWRRGATAAVMVCVVGVALHAQPSYVWYSLGLGERNVTCLLVDDTTYMLAGTDRGVWVRWQGEWYQVTGGIPTNAQVTALVRLASGGVVAAVGGGSNSDGVYVGEMRIYGPPFYVFTLLEYVQSPQSLAVRGARTDTLYAGAGNRVLISVADGAGFGPFRELKLPSGPFGVEMPVCAALHVCTADNLLYAGGHDASPDPAIGSLLRQEGRDSMSALVRRNVSSITQGTFMEVGPVELVVGTTDSGIYRGRPSQPFSAWTRYESPLRQPVRHIIAVPGMIWSDVLYVAVAGGVYSGVGPSWAEVGDIPAAPNVLAAQAYGLPYAGTVRGVYRYGQPPLSAVPRPAARTSASRPVRAMSVGERLDPSAARDLLGRPSSAGTPGLRVGRE